MTALKSVWPRAPGSAGGAPGSAVCTLPVVDQIEQPEQPAWERRRSGAGFRTNFDSDRALGLLQSKRGVFRGCCGVRIARGDILGRQEGLRRTGGGEHGEVVPENRVGIVLAMNQPSERTALRTSSGCTVPALAAASDNRRRYHRRFGRPQFGKPAPGRPVLNSRGPQRPGPPDLRPATEPRTRRLPARTAAARRLASPRLRIAGSRLAAAPAGANPHRARFAGSTGPRTKGGSHSSACSKASRSGFALGIPAVPA